jgi:hypothetical protein
MAAAFARTMSDPAGSRRARAATTAANRARRRYAATLRSNVARLAPLIAGCRVLLADLEAEKAANEKALALCE